MGSYTLKTKIQNIKGEYVNMNNTKQFKKNLERFCYQNVKGTTDIFMEDIKEMLEEIDTTFDPILYWDFKPIFSFETHGDYFMAHNYRNNKLFGANGFLLQELTGNFSSECFDSDEKIEIWLLEDMRIVVTEGYHLDIDGNSSIFCADYRSPTKDLRDFEIESFLKEIQGKMGEIHYIR